MDRKRLKRNQWKDQFNYSTRTKQIVLVLLVFLFFFTISVGFSALSQTLGLNTNVEIRPDKEVRITNVDGPYLKGGAYENGNYQYSHNLLISKGVLPNSESTIQYKLTVTNNGSSDKSLDEIIADLPEGVEYRLVDFQIGDEIPAKESVVITVEFYNPTEESITYSGELKFLFSDVYVDITAPTITFEPEKDSWFNKDTDVTIKATDDRTVKEFKYCTKYSSMPDSSLSCTPDTDGDPEGTKVALSTEGYHAVCVTATDNAKNPNTSSECSIYVMDKTAPTIMVNGSNENQTIKVGLGSAFTLPEASVHDGYDENPTLKTSGNVNTSVEGTYTITYTATDKAGNQSTLVLTVEVLSTTPTIQSWAAVADTDFHNSTYREQINIAEFVTTNVVPTDAVASWDVSAAKDGSVMAWVVNAKESGKYDLYIGGEGGVTANTDSSFLFYNFPNLKEINGLENFDTSNTTNMVGMFEDCRSLEKLDVSNFDTSKVTNMSYMFFNCTKLATLDVSNFNTSNVTNMADMFLNCASLTTLDLSNFNTAKVTEMFGMFSSCTSLTTLDLSHFDTSNVTNMSSMFYGCTNLTTLDVSSFDTSNVTNMYLMFYGCASLTTLDLSHFDTKNVTNMSSMFAKCSSLGKLKFSASKYGVNVNSIFDNTPRLHEITVIASTGSKISLNTNHNDCSELQFFGWFPNKEGTGTAMTAIPSGVSNATYYAVFEKDTEAPVITVDGHTSDFTIRVTPGTTFVIPTATVTDNSGDIIKAVVSGNVNTDIEGTYTITYTATDASGNYSLLNMHVNVNYPVFTNGLLNGTSIEKTQITSVEFLTTNVVPSDAIKSWDASLESHDGSVMAWVINDLENTGKYKLYVGGDGSIYAPSTLDSLFENWSSLSSVDMTKVNTSNVVYARAMFAYCTNLTELDLSTFDVSKVDLADSMFRGCTNLTTLNVRNWNTSKLRSMSYMFYDCEKLSILDLSDFDTSNVEYMEEVFYNCNSLTSLNVRNWNTSKVYYMNSMFYNCRSLATLDISNWDTSTVTTMRQMFAYCNSLTSLNINSWNVSNVTDMYQMFSYCKSLTSLDVSNWNTSKVEYMTGMFMGCSNLQEVSINIANASTRVSSSTSDIFGDTPKLHKITVNTAVDIPLNKKHSNCTPGMIYLGWFDNKDGSGSAITTIPAGANGAYYAVFKEAQAPTIVVDGKSEDYSVEISQYTNYTIPSAVATDSEGNSVNVIVSGLVNTSIPGEYVVTYTATDSKGVFSTLQLTVIVTESDLSDWVTEEELIAAGFSPSDSGVQSKLQYRDRKLTGYSVWQKTLPSNNAHEVQTKTRKQEFAFYTNPTTTVKYQKNGILYFNNQAQVTLPRNEYTTLGNSDFTIEWYENRSSVSGDAAVINFGGSGSQYSLLAGYVGGENVIAYVSTNGTSWAISALHMGTVQLNTWVHRAIMRKGTTIYTFENGKLIASKEIGTAAIYQSSTALPTIGYGAWGTSSYYHGSLTDIRITKEAVYETTGYNVPEMMYSTGKTQLEKETTGTKLSFQIAKWGNASTCDGKDSCLQNTVTPETTYVDWSDNTTVGVSGSGYLNFGTNSQITYPLNNITTLRSSNFTVEWWEYRRSAIANASIANFGGGGMKYSLLVGYLSDNLSNIMAYFGSNGTSWVSSRVLGTIQLNTWVHRAVMRKGTTLYGFENGKLIGSTEIGNVSLHQASDAKLLLGYNAWNKKSLDSYVTDFVVSNYDKYDTAGFKNPSRKYLEKNGSVTVSSGTYRYPLITTYRGIQDINDYYRTKLWGDYSDWQDNEITEGTDNIVETRTLYRYPVSTAPTLTIDATSPSGANGWYKGPVKFNVDAANNPKSLQYALSTDNGTIYGNWTEIENNTFTIDAQGEHLKVKVQSINQSNKTSETTSDTFKIDSVAPEVTFAASGGGNAK